MVASPEQVPEWACSVEATILKKQEKNFFSIFFLSVEKNFFFFLLLFRLGSVHWAQRSRNKSKKKKKFFSIKCGWLYWASEVDRSLSRANHTCESRKRSRSTSVVRSTEQVKALHSLSKADPTKIFTKILRKKNRKKKFFFLIEVWLP